MRGSRAVISSSLALAVVLAAGCDAGKTKLIGSDYCSFAPGPPPAGTDGFYTQYLDAAGVPVMSSSAVDPKAVVDACLIVAHMLSLRADVRNEMVNLNMSVAIIGVNEVTTDIPEYKNLNTMFPMQDWNRLRGVGATKPIPVSSVGEENLLCIQGDMFAGEQLLVQTFATGVLLAVEDVDRSFMGRLDAAFSAAGSAGLWKNTYASQNDIEYYAEGVQSWFDANHYVMTPDGNNGPISTRGELQAYDPALAMLIAETMRGDSWRPMMCP
ncbi:MAG TPA: hypothetical protein VKQ32_29640 [Polyangia bacterium]|nr:hypothetical protein [Polyangia bacterium]